MQDFGEQQEASEGALTRWLDAAPEFESDSAALKAVYDKSIVDLAALRIEGTLADEPYVLPAAGLPWFMTLFGRDTLITSLQTSLARISRVAPSICSGSCRETRSTSSATRSREDPPRDPPGRADRPRREASQPVLRNRGRHAAVAHLAVGLLAPHRRRRFVRGTGSASWPPRMDRPLRRPRRGRIRRVRNALVRGPRQSVLEGLLGRNSVRGRPHSVPPDRHGGDPGIRLRREVARRRARPAEHGRHYACRPARARGRRALHPVQQRLLVGRARWLLLRRSRRGQTGHRLPHIEPGPPTVVGDRARGARAHHCKPPPLRDLFSGWGVRTLSRQDLGYNPIGYHTGTIWPHDNAIIASGWRGTDSATRRTGSRSPRSKPLRTRASVSEAFAGFDRVLSGFPVPYPTACSPQAWATGAPFVFVKVMLGLEARDREIHLDPHVPDEIGRIQIRNMPASARWDVEANGTRGFVRLAR